MAANSVHNPACAVTPGTDTAPATLYETRPLDASVERHDRFYRRSLALADGVAALAALTLAVGARWTVLLAAPLAVGASKLHGLYDRDELLLNKTTVDEGPRLLGLATFYTLLVVVLFGRTVTTADILVLWGSLFALAMLCRHGARSTVRRLNRPERCLFIGNPDSHERMRRKLEGADVKADLVGRLNLEHVLARGERLGDLEDLREMIRWTRAHRVIIESEALPAEEMLDLVRAAKSAGVRVSLLPRVLEVVGSEVVFDSLDGMTLLGVPRFGLSRSSMLVKRSFDLVGALAILALAAPLMILIAVAIKLDSRGPVLFRQTRVGRDGSHFKIFKFRTMVPEAEALKTELRTLNEAQGGLFKITRDPRITRVGRFLRGTSLDELPQLLNVVRGDMSLVGPRPLIVDEDANIRGWDRRRLALTPGMTGHWQIAGSARIPLHEMVKIDYLYVASWSLWADLKILLRTVPYVLSRRGL